jgi:hypothetical protein
MRRGRAAASLPAMRTSLLPLSLLAALAIVPGAADAATITSDGGGTYTYSAAAGETNNMSLQGRDDPGTVVFYAYGAPITSAPAGCTVSDSGSDATCLNVKAAVVNLGDGDDSFSKSTPPSMPVTVDGGPGKDWLKGYDGDDVLHGGPGNDKLEGWKGNDTLDGGDGDDELDGAAGADHLQGGAGNDLLHPDDFQEPSSDVVDGGPGIDTIDGDYADYDLTVQQPLFFTMAGGADDGRPGENDDVENVEQLRLGISPTKYVGTEGNDFVKVAQATNAGELIGNGGDDDLSGADGIEKIDGGAGNDRLVGGFNDDTITGGPGRDQLIGDLPTGDCGPIWCKYPFGNDTIYAQDGEVDTISCGWGTDTVYADAADVVDGDCENVTRAGTAPTGPAPGTTGGSKSSNNGASSGTATAAVVGRVRIATALKSGFTVKVTGVKAGTVLKLSATRSGKLVARGSAKATKSGTATVKLKFTTKAKRSLRHAKTITLKISGGGASTTITLKRK